MRYGNGRCGMPQRNTIPQGCPAERNAATILSGDAPCPVGTNTETNKQRNEPNKTGVFVIGFDREYGLVSIDRQRIPPSSRVRFVQSSPFVVYRTTHTKLSESNARTVFDAIRSYPGTMDTERN
mmetsp:Transcript_15937/g.44095  ORF Transcript_15937/g.44095 Transcript_15937/m.44095 type:complete len:124 (-) Transcript_15937:127-498(-)